MKMIFVVSQTPDRQDWQVTQRDGSVFIRTSYHSSRARALASITGRLAGVKQLAIVISDAEETGEAAP